MCVTVSFLIYFILYLRAICKNKPLGVFIQRGDLMEDFMRYEFGALIFEGGYTWKGLFLEFYGSCFYYWACRQGFFCVQLHAELVNTM